MYANGKNAHPLNLNQLSYIKFLLMHFAISTLHLGTSKAMVLTVAKKTTIQYVLSQLTEIRWFG